MCCAAENGGIIKVSSKLETILWEYFNEEVNSRD